MNTRERLILQDDVDDGDDHEVILLKLVNQLTLDIMRQLLRKRSLSTNPSRLCRLHPEQHKCCAGTKVSKKSTDLRPFFQPREWPLWNWPLSVGGTELRYLGVEVSSQIIQLSHLKSGPGNIGKSGGLRSGKGILPSTSPPLTTLFERLAQKIWVFVSSFIFLYLPTEGFLWTFVGPATRNWRLIRHFLCN